MSPSTSTSTRIAPKRSSLRPTTRVTCGNRVTSCSIGSMTSRSMAYASNDGSYRLIRSHSRSCAAGPDAPLHATSPSSRPTRTAVTHCPRARTPAASPFDAREIFDGAFVEAVSFAGGAAHDLRDSLEDRLGLALLAELDE